MSPFHCEVRQDKPGTWTAGSIPEGAGQVDPSGSRTGDAVGIVVVGIDAQGLCYVLEDATVSGESPQGWASEAVSAYFHHRADRIVGERNFGADMVEHTIRTVDPNVSYKDVYASRGKAIRAEPVAARYEREDVFHTRALPELEDEMCMWTPDFRWSPNRLDALVFGVTELAIQPAWNPAIP